MPEFLIAVREMRERLQAMEGGDPSFKNSAGAIYDIDFISEYLLIRNGVTNKGGTLRDRLWRCVAAGILSKANAAELDHAAELFRTVEHMVRLTLGRARKWLPATEHAQKVTQLLTSQILNREFPDGLESELQQTCARVRAIYDCVLTQS
jgi:glutamine synthetase adenylyltransferase